jgi:hypothetical protein
LSCPARPSGRRRRVIKKLLRAFGPYEDLFKTDRIQTPRMADFLVVLGIVAFALAMLGLIWALERV